MIVSVPDHYLSFYLEKPCFSSSVITEQCASASRITRPDSPMRHINTDKFLHDMAHISHVA